MHTIEDYVYNLNMTTSGNELNDEYTSINKNINIVSNLNSVVKMIYNHKDTTLINIVNDNIYTNLNIKYTGNIESYCESIVDSIKDFLIKIYDSILDFLKRVSKFFKELFTIRRDVQVEKKVKNTVDEINKKVDELQSKKVDESKSKTDEQIRILLSLPAKKDIMKRLDKMENITSFLMKQSPQDILLYDKLKSFFDKNKDAEIYTYTDKIKYSKIRGHNFLASENTKLSLVKSVVKDVKEVFDAYNTETKKLSKFCDNVVKSNIMQIKERRSKINKEVSGLSEEEANKKRDKILRIQKNLAHFNQILIATSKCLIQDRDRMVKELSSIENKLANYQN